MTGLRALIRDYRMLAIFVVALAMFVKVTVPQGYMVGNGQTMLTVQLCLDGTTHKTVQIALPADDSAPAQGSNSMGDDGKADSPCAFSALCMGTMAGADGLLLALALAFILALGFAPAHPVLRGQISYLRPPLRGPPAAA